MIEPQKPINVLYNLAKDQISNRMLELRSANVDEPLGDWRFGDEFRKILRDAANSIFEVARSSYISFDGHSLFNEIGISLSVQNGKLTAGVQKTESGYEIQISSEFLSIIYLMCELSFPIDVAGASESQELMLSNIQREHKCGGSNRRIAFLMRRYGLVLDEKSDPILKFTHLLLTNDNAEVFSAGLSNNFLHSLYWLISHEIGHILAGHVDHAAQFGEGIGISEDYNDIAKSLENSDFPGFEHDNLIDRQSMELMADSYATIRLALLCDIVFIVSHDFEPCDYLRAYLSGRVVVTLLIGVQRKSRAGEDSAELQRVYPDETMRLLNVFAAAYFCIAPLENAYHPIPFLITAAKPRSESPLAEIETLEEYTKFFLKDMELILRSTLYLSICSGVIDYTKFANLIQSLPTILSLPVLMRIGSSIFQREKLNDSNLCALSNEIDFYINQSPQTEIRELSVQWDAILKRLVLHGNGPFVECMPSSCIGSVGEEAYNGYIDTYITAQNPALQLDSLQRDLVLYDRFLDRSLSSRKKLASVIMNDRKAKRVRDPAYLVLDNWMSQMSAHFSQGRYEAGINGALERQAQILLTLKWSVQACNDALD